MEEEGGRRRGRAPTPSTRFMFLMGLTSLPAGLARRGRHTFILMARSMAMVAPEVEMMTKEVAWLDCQASRPWSRACRLGAAEGPRRAVASRERRSRARASRRQHASWLRLLKEAGLKTR